jgi:hypothetical protein
MMSLPTLRMLGSWERRVRAALYESTSSFTAMIVFRCTILQVHNNLSIQL